jgi:vanillate O-demethylase ferredoxin subunit
MTVDIDGRRRRSEGSLPRAGAAEERFRVEIFSKEAPMAEDAAIEVVLRRSGLTFIVPPEKSILQVLIEEGIDPMYDCQRGECGICQVAVLEGEPDHRDHILSESERAGNKVMQVCVSRAKTPRLVIHL